MDIGEEKRVVEFEPLETPNEAPVEPAAPSAPSVPVVEPEKEPVGA